MEIRSMTTEQGGSTVLEVLREVAARGDLDRLSDDSRAHGDHFGRTTLLFLPFFGP